MKAERLAKVLKAMTTGVSASEATSAYKSFSEYLTKKGYSSLLPRILREYERLEKRTTKGVVVTVAKKRDVKGILKAHGIEDTATTRIDETIVGGYTIETDTKLIDASHKNALIALYQRFTR